MKFHNHLKSLFYFSVAAKHLSLKAAAEELFVSQAAVSQQIRLLEEFLGAKLFRRKHRAIELTAEGERLIPYLRSAFSDINTGISELNKDQDPNTLILSVFPSFASRWLIPRLGKFYKKHPRININLSMSDKYESFDDIDLAIRFTANPSDDLKSIFLMKDYIYPASHPDFIKSQNIRVVDDLKHQRLLEDTNTHLSWDYWLKKTSFKQQLGEQSDINNRDRYDGSHYVIDSVLSAQGIAMVRHSLVADAIEQKQLVRLFNNPVELHAQFYLCAPERYFNYPKVQTFTNWIHEEVDQFKTTRKLKL